MVDDRYDFETQLGEKPRTTLWVLRGSNVSLTHFDRAAIAAGTRSVGMDEAFRVDGALRTGCCTVLLRSIRSIILARLMGVMCFSLPRADASEDVDSDAPERIAQARTVVSVRTFGSSSSDADSTLVDSSGTSWNDDGCDFCFRIGIVGEVADATATAAADWSSQQKVSRFHSLQLRFSRRRPFSSDSAHFENTFRFHHD